MEELKKDTTTPVSARKFPTLLGLGAAFLLLLSLNFVGQRLIFSSKAGSTSNPKNVTVSNITPNSFVVSWETEKPTSGAAKIFLTEEKIIADPRDLQNNGKADHVTHYVLVEGLAEGKSYEFMVGSGGVFYGKDGKKDSSQRFSAKTAIGGTVIPQEAKLAYGQVVDNQNNPVDGALVYLNIDGISLLSGITSSSGYWMVPLSSAYKSDLSGEANYQEGALDEKITVSAGSSGRSEVLNYTRNNKPVPPIVIGKDDDFRDFQKAAALPTKIEEGQTRLPLSTEQAPVLPVEFTIINPEENESLGSSRPEIFGRGPSGVEVEVLVESAAQYQGKITVAEDGFWRWSPPADLTAGNHTITASYIDANGQKRTLTRQFYVLAADESLAFTASPSASIKPSSTIMPTRIVAPSASVTPTTRLPTGMVTTITPTGRAFPTATITPISSTVTPRVTSNASPSAAATISQIPQTGTVAPLAFSLVAGVFILLLGLALIF